MGMDPAQQATAIVAAFNRWRLEHALVAIRVRESLNHNAPEAVLRPLVDEARGQLWALFAMKKVCVPCHAMSGSGPLQTDTWRKERTLSSFRSPSGDSCSVSHPRRKIKRCAHPFIQCLEVGHYKQEHEGRDKDLQVYAVLQGILAVHHTSKGRSSDSGPSLP